MQLVVRHGDDGENQVNEIERTEENDNDEKQHVPGTGRSQYQLIQIFPVILGHQTKSRQKGPAERVETRVAVVRISTVALQTRVVRWTLPANIFHVTTRSIRDLQGFYQS